MDKSKSEKEKSCERCQHLMNNHRERFKFLFNNEIMSDIQFVVNTGRNDEKKRFYTHKFLLAIRSPVFEAMFYGSLANDSKEIEIVDITPEAFEIMLSFIYTEEFSDVADLQTVFMTIYAAEKYQLDCLMKVCCEFLSKKITPVSALEILVKAKYYDLEDLANKCMDEIRKNTYQSIKSKEFLNIDMQSLCTILQSDNLRIDEYQLYHQVLEWLKAECNRQNLSDDIKNLRKVLGDAIKLIRFPLMTSEEIATISSEPEKCILINSEIVNIFQQITLGTFCKTSPFNNKPRKTFICVNVSENTECKICNLKEFSIDFIPDLYLKLLGFTMDGSFKNQGVPEVFHRISLTEFQSMPKVIRRISLVSCVSSTYHHTPEIMEIDEFCLLENESADDTLHIRFDQELTLSANNKYTLYIQLNKVFETKPNVLKKYCTFRNSDGRDAVLKILNYGERTFFSGLLFSPK